MGTQAPPGLPQCTHMHLGVCCCAEDTPAVTALLPDWEALGLLKNVIQVIVSFGFRKLQVKGHLKGPAGRLLWKTR